MQARILLCRWLRSLPHDDSPLNGVQVDEGEKVIVLNREETEGGCFLWVLAGRKKGYLELAL